MTDRDKALREVAALVSAVLRYAPAALEAEIYPVAFLLGTGGHAGPETVERALREALGLTDEACELLSARNGTRCTEPSAVRLTGACPHGHLTERRVCEGHRAAEEPLWCRACYRLPDPGDHKCPVTLIGAEAVQAAGTEGQ
jgi:hypothetical protein